MMLQSNAFTTDVQRTLQDPYFNALMNWDDVQEEEKEKLQNENPETVDLTEAIEDARYEVRDLTRWMDSDVRRFLDDVATTVSALAMLYPPTRAGAMVYGGVRGAIALAPRAVPHLGRAAVVIGAGAVAGYDRIRAFFSERAGGDGRRSGDKGSSKGRVQNTPQDMQKFAQDKISKGILEKRNDGSYEFIKNAGKFQKGDRLTKDLLHNEYEWWSKRGVHKGAIEPKGGTKYKPADSNRRLKF